MINDTATSAWLRLRYMALESAKSQCACCGLGVKDGIVLHVDHIKPLALCPELAFDPNNLQVLCTDCCLGRSRSDETDFRKES